MSEIDPAKRVDETSDISVNRTDGAVAVDEKDRTVLLTENEAFILEKQPQYDVIPANRPRKVYGGMWGTMEIAVAGLGIFAILGALAIYFFYALPASRELERNRSTRDRLEAELISARDKYGDITDTRTRVTELISSVDNFESQYLPVASVGRIALYQRINALIAAYGLVNTSGPDYAPLDIADQGNNDQTDEERGRAKFRSIYPGAYITMTLEGPYQNLRRFIRDVETGREFVIISSIQLEPSDSQPKSRPNGQQGETTASGDQAIPGFQQFPGARNPSQRIPQQVFDQPAMPKGRTRGEVVSLRLEMAAYFRRSNEAPQAEAQK